MEKTDTIVAGVGESGTGQEASVHFERLAYARIDGPGPVLAYMADEKTHVSHVHSWPVLQRDQHSVSSRKNLSRHCFAL